MLVRGRCGGDVGARGGSVEGGGGGGGCNHPGEAWLCPILTVRFQVGRGGNPNNFCRVHNMPMMKVGHLFMRRG